LISSRKLETFMKQVCRSFFYAVAVVSAGTAMAAAAEITPGASGVTASTSDTNVPGNAVDNNLSTRWSGNGDGATLRFDLGSVQTVAYVTLAVYNGNSRQNHFDLGLSTDGTTWTTVAPSRSTSGTSNAEEIVDFTDMPARYVRYVGHGSTAGTWNSLTEVSIFSASTSTPTSTPAATATTAPTPTSTPTPTATGSTPTPPTYTEITPGASAVTASTNDGNVPGNAVDNNLLTRWSANGDGQWIQFDLGTTQTVGYVKIAVYNGNSRQNKFDLQVSTGGGTWTNVLTAAMTGGTTTAEQMFDFPDVSARFVRYVGHMSNVGTFNSVSELSIFGVACTSCPTPTPTAAVTPTATPTPSTGNYTAAQVLAGVKANMVSSKQVNTKPHINTMTHSNVNVYQVSPGAFAYTAGMAIDTDGSDSDPDPDHQGQTTWSDNSGKALGAHHVAFFVLGDDCWDRTSPCPHFFYKEHSITGLQFALFFYNGKVIGGVFGDTQTANNQTTSDNDSRELGEASVHAASMLGIPSSGTTGGVDNGVTYVILSGSSWVVKGADSTTLNTNAQALIQKALNQLGAGMGL
jgi:hypothetical protein